MGVHRHHIFVHDLPDDLIGLTQQQVAQSHRAQKFTLSVQHIADIDGLTVQSHRADSVNSPLHRQALLQIHILHRHDAACGVLRIAQQMVNIPTGLRAGVLQQALHHIGRHLLQQVHRIVGHQIVNDIGSLPVRQGGDDGLLSVHLQIGKDIRRQILGQDPKSLDHALLRQFLHVRGNIRVV